MLTVPFTQQLMKGAIMIAIILVLTKMVSFQVFAATIDTRQLAYSFASQSISQKQETRLAAYNEMKEIFSEFHLSAKMDSKKFEQTVQNNEAFRTRLFEVASKYKIKALKKEVTRIHVRGQEDEEGSDSDLGRSIYHSQGGKEYDQWG